VKTKAFPFFYSMPTRIIGGAGSLACLPEEVSKFSRKCLIVTGRRSAQLAGSLEKVRELLQSAHIDSVTYDQVEPNPTMDTIHQGAELARKNKARWVLAIGGGSPLDAAKGIALMTVNQGEIQSFFSGVRPEHPPLPVVAIPTTSGTGSEVTPYAVLTDQKKGDKSGLSMPELFPVLAILDPELTATMPENVTVNTGLDALCHAVEALFSTRRTLITDLIAKDAIARIVRYLPGIRKTPNELEARWELQVSATMAGWAIANTTTLVPHAMSYPVTVRYDLPHGRAAALLLPAFLEAVQPVEPERVAWVGEALGNSKDAPGALRRLIESLGVAPRLRAYGMREEDVEPFTRLVKDKRHLVVSPGCIDESKVRELYLKSL
jgi:alcohol dehydrogenase class IV